MIVRIIVIMAGCALTGCVTRPNRPALEQAEVSAEYLCQELPFAGISDCVEMQFNKAYPRWRADPNADLINIFLAWSRAESARVSNGLVTEQEAKERGHLLQGRLDQIAYDRRIQAQINSQAAAQMMLAGLAIMAASRPIAPAGAPIICNTTGNASFATTICQ